MTLRWECYFTQFKNKNIYQRSSNVLLFWVRALKYIVYRILPLKLCLSHSLWNLPKLGLKYKIVKVVTLPLTTDHMLEADTCLPQQFLSVLCAPSWGEKASFPLAHKDGHPLTKTTCKEILYNVPTIFPEDLQLSEGKGRSCLMSEELARSAGRQGEVVEGTRERSGTGQWGSVGMQERSTSKLQVMLKTTELLQAPVLCTWLMGSDASPLKPSPYRTLYQLPLIT